MNQFEKKYRPESRNTHSLPAHRKRTDCCTMATTNTSKLAVAQSEIYSSETCFVGGGRRPAGGGALGYINQRNNRRRANDACIVTVSRLCNVKTPQPTIETPAVISTCKPTPEARFDNRVTLTFDLLTLESMRGEVLPCSMYVPSLVALMGQVVFYYRARTHTHTHTHTVADATDHSTHASATTVGVGNYVH